MPAILEKSLIQKVLKLINRKQNKLEENKDCWEKKTSHTTTYSGRQWNTLHAWNKNRILYKRSSLGIRKKTIGKQKMIAEIKKLREGLEDKVKDIVYMGV